MPSQSRPFAATALAAAAAALAATIAAPAVADTIRIGYISPLTGSHAEFSETDPFVLDEMVGRRGAAGGGKGRGGKGGERGGGGRGGRGGGGGQGTDRGGGRGHAADVRVDLGVRPGPGPRRGEHRGGGRGRR